MNTRHFCRQLASYLFCLLVCILLLPAFSKAENGSPWRWQNKYRSYGRTIDIDVNILVPKNDNIPLLAVEPMKELSSQEIESLQKTFLTKFNMDKETVSLNSRSNRIWLSCSDHESHPDIFDAEKVTTPAKALPMYDRGMSYAENNSLTIEEAEEIIRQRIRHIYPSVDFWIQDVVINDRTKYRNNGVQLTDKGYYEIYCVQVIDGVPVAASIHEAYRLAKTKKDFILASYGTAHINITDENNFDGYYNLWNKITELGIPDQLISFDEARMKIEGMIMDGNVRNVYHFCKGYAQYDLPKGSRYEYVLVPAWIVWVEWADNAVEETDVEAINSTGLYTESYCYLPIVINAITGETTSPMDESETRMLLPMSCMGWVEDD